VWTSLYHTSCGILWHYLVFSHVLSLKMYGITFLVFCLVLTFFNRCFYVISYFLKWLVFLFQLFEAPVEKDCREDNSLKIKKTLEKEVGSTFNSFLVTRILGFNKLIKWIGIVNSKLHKWVDLFVVNFWFWVSFYSSCNETSSR
jgi:hypothetical protein